MCFEEYAQVCSLQAASSQQLTAVSSNPEFCNTVSSEFELCLERVLNCCVCLAFDRSANDSL